MKSKLFVVSIVAIASAGLLGCSSLSPRDAAQASTARVVFGSCVKQNKAQPIWEAINLAQPDLFIFAGDNIYADTENMRTMRSKYKALGREPGYKTLRRSGCPILATWDDHDYGVNDGGAEYPRKEESKKEFLRFFKVPKSSPVYQRPGIYHSEFVTLAGLNVQVILLDTRTFRGPLVKHNKTYPDRGPYTANPDTGATLLGTEQWTWLEEELKKEADLRILVSSIQVVPEEHHWEKWMNLPHERERLFELIAETGASRIVVLSGDRHHGELSRMNAGFGYPLYDLTASGLNQGFARPKEEHNAHRIGDLFIYNHFGVIDIDTSGPEPMLELSLRDEAGKVVLSYPVQLSELE